MLGLLFIACTGSPAQPVPPRTVKAQAAEVSPAEKAALRVTCEGSNVDASISLNGVFKGTCPVDISILAGTYVLRSSKPVDEKNERVFELELRLAGGTAKRVEIVLGETRLTAEAKRLEDEKTRMAAQALAEKKSHEMNELRALTQKASAGDIDAMLAAAEVYSAGSSGVPKDEVQAFVWIATAAQAGRPLAMSRLATRYEAGVGVEKSLPQAFAWYLKAAEAGDPGGIGGVAAFYRNKTVPVPKPEDTIAWARKGVEAGDGRAMLNLALLLIEGVNKGDPSYAEIMREAEELLNQAAAKENPRALYFAGACYFKGLPPCAANRDRAMPLLYRAAATGPWGGDATAEAAVLIGNFFDERGKDIANATEAVDWYKKAAAGGSAEGMFYLGLSYMDGSGGVPKNDHVALDWFRRGAAGGDNEAMNNVGWFYLHGLGGLKKNSDEAMVWFRRSAAAGSRRAANNVRLLQR